MGGARRIFKQPTRPYSLSVPVCDSLRHQADSLAHFMFVSLLFPNSVLRFLIRGLSIKSCSLSQVGVVTLHSYLVLIVAICCIPHIVCSVPTAERIVILPNQVILCASCTAPHHTRRIHCIPATDRCGPSFTAAVAGRTRYHVLSCQFGCRSGTYKSFVCTSLILFYYTKLCYFASFMASRHTFPICCTPATVRRKLTRMAHCHRKDSLPHSLCHINYHSLSPRRSLVPPTDRTDIVLIAYTARLEVR